MIQIYNQFLICLKMGYITIFFIFVFRFKFSLANDCLAKDVSFNCQICPSKEIVKLEDLNENDDILKGDKMFIIENSGR